MSDAPSIAAGDYLLEPSTGRSGVILDMSSSCVRIEWRRAPTGDEGFRPFVVVESMATVLSWLWHETLAPDPEGFL